MLNDRQAIDRVYRYRYHQAPALLLFWIGVDILCADWISWGQVRVSSSSFGGKESHWALLIMNSYVKGHRRTPAWLSRVLHLAPFSPAKIWRSGENYGGKNKIAKYGGSYWHAAWAQHPSPNTIYIHPTT